MTANIEEHNRVVDYKDIVDLETMKAYIERYSLKETFTVDQLIMMINAAISRGKSQKHTKKRAAMNILTMTKQDFAAVPYLSLYNDWDRLAPNGRLEFNGLVIIPVENKDGTVNLHESGFGCMEFCLIDENDEPIGRVGGGSDVVNLDGIGGYGADWVNKHNKAPTQIPIHGWTLDLLPCGYLRILARKHLLINNQLNRLICSNLEVFSED